MLFRSSPHIRGFRYEVPLLVFKSTNILISSENSRFTNVCYFISFEIRDLRELATPVGREWSLSGYGDTQHGKWIVGKCVADIHYNTPVQLPKIRSMRRSWKLDRQPLTTRAAHGSDLRG